jgi:hypothetical protein
MSPHTPLRLRFRSDEPTLFSGVALHGAFYLKATGETRSLRRGQSLVEWMWQGQAQSHCRRGRGEPSPVAFQTWQGCIQFSLLVIQLLHKQQSAPPRHGRVHVCVNLCERGTAVRLCTTLYNIMH